MALKLANDCQAALDLAKRALPEGEELDAQLLIAALCHFADLEEAFPTLASRLPEPKLLRQQVPETVPVEARLRPVLTGLAKEGADVTAEELLRALIESDAGEPLLRSLGLEQGELFPAASEAAGTTEAPDNWRDSQERQGAIAALESFGRMLTLGAPPHAGVVRMDAPLNSLVRTLSKMGRRNAIVIGYPGTGKSAVVYELARRIANGDPAIPEGLRDRDIFELSPSFLRSGASMVGQYDERVKALLEVLNANPKIVLFIDEIHSLFQSGVHERGPFSDANESFKGALGRGEITCIGCTTPTEYRHFIEPDGALTRRFSVIRLEPPDAEATAAILGARLPRLRAYYESLEIPDAMIERSVALTDDYLPSRYQPDKAIQLLDEACAWCVTSSPPVPEVGEDALWNALEDMIGHGVVRSGRLTEADVFNQLQGKVIGQDDTLREVARAFIAGMGEWTSRSGPRGVMFFCGPTGVGKTETALRIAEVLGGGDPALIEVNCNTLQGSGHDSGPAINVLLGPPPGYIGYVRGGGGVLSAIRDEPESVVLFDEIEKADPGVGKILLQILDEGSVEDSDGNTLDFRRSFVLFTTNAGCVYDQHSIGFDSSATSASPSVDVESVKAEMRALGFGEEFLGRIDRFFVFQGLEPEAIRTIIERRLDRLRGTADVKGYELNWEPEIIEHLASDWQPRFGVRHLISILRHRIVEQLSLADAQGELSGIKKIALSVLRDESSACAGTAVRERNDDTLTIRLA